MEYVQERVTTLHDLRDPTPDAPVEQAAVVVPMTEREYNGLAAERVLSELEAVGPARVVVPLRASADQVGHFADWLTSFDLPLEVLWCNGSRLSELLTAHGLDGERGKGRDVWLALGRAMAEEYVVVHDADTKTYSRSDVPRLLFPLAHGHGFSKGYYARVEDNRLYGRLFRLFYAPLVRTLVDTHDAPILRYLDAFRYALAGEFAATSDVVGQLRVARTWGLEVSTLCDAFDAVGFDGSAQVDLGAYAHDHRSVGGPTGLSEMSGAVGATLLRTLADHGVDVDFETLREQYRDTAEGFVRQYGVDAAFNGLAYDRDSEAAQVEAYAAALRPPGPDTRLPAWDAVSLTPEDVYGAATEDLRDAK